MSFEDRDLQECALLSDAPVHRAGTAGRMNRRLSALGNGEAASLNDAKRPLGVCNPVFHRP